MGRLKNLNVTNLMLWGVYIMLLCVLLPHTAWAFATFEPQDSGGQLVGWFGAVAFEFAILVLTHKLAKHIESVPNRKDTPRKFQRRYLNAYAAGLVVAIGVSTLANLAHAVEFGQTMAIFAKYNIPFGVYAVAFGAVLPIVSLLFARVLSNVQEAEIDENPAKTEVKELRAQLREQGKQLVAAEVAGVQFGLYEQLRTEDKAQRIKAAMELWPDAKQTVYATVTNVSPSYVSEIMSSNGHGKGD